MQPSLLSRRIRRLATGSDLDDLAARLMRRRVGQGDMFYSMIRNDMEHRSSPARRERARAALAKVNTAHTVIHDNGT